MECHHALVNRLLVDGLIEDASAMLRQCNEICGTSHGRGDIVGKDDLSRLRQRRLLGLVWSGRRRDAREVVRIDAPACAARPRRTFSGCAHGEGWDFAEGFRSPAVPGDPAGSTRARAPGAASQRARARAGGGASPSLSPRTAARDGRRRSEAGGACGLPQQAAAAQGARRAHEAACVARAQARAGEGDGGPRTGGDLCSPRAGAGAGARQGWAAVAARGRARVGWRRRMLRSPMLTLPMALPHSLMRPPRAPRSS